MNKNTNTHDRITAVILAQTQEVWEADAPHAADDGYIGDMLDAISPCPRYDMLDEDWETIEDRLSDIDPDLDDEGDREFLRKAMADGTRQWLLAHPAEVVAYLAEDNPGYLRRDLDALRAVGTEDDAHLETVGVGYMSRALFAAFGMDPLEDEGEEFDALFDALYEFLLERV